MRTFLASILFICISLVFTACPSKTDLASAKKRSAQLAGISDAAADVTLTLFNKKIITLEQKDKIADAFIRLSKAGIKFDEAVIGLELQWGNNPPKANLEQLFTMLNDEVVGLFLDAISELTGINLGYFNDIIQSFKSAVLAIAKVFGRGKTAIVEAKLEGI